MAFRSQAAFLAATITVFGQSFAIRGGGTLSIQEDGIVFHKAAKKKATHNVWVYPHLQQVKLEDNRIEIVTYEDSPRWKLGVDRSFTYTLADPEKDFAEVQKLLREKLDQRFVAAAVVEPPRDFEWKALVKRLGLVKGSEGTLYVGRDEIVYHSALRGESRSWRLRDLENVHSSGPFELTLTTLERSRMDYGSRKSFNFRLKEPIEQARVDALWRKLARLP